MLFWNNKKNAYETPQLHVDPADGKAYPLDSFLECYGQDEGGRWASAGQQPAYPGISLMQCMRGGFVCLSPPLGLFLPVSLEPVFLPVALALAWPAAPLPLLVTLPLLFRVLVERFM